MPQKLQKMKIIYLLFYIILNYAKDIYFNSLHSCNNSCDGTIQNPYSSLYTGLTLANFSNNLNYNIIFNPAAVYHIGEIQNNQVNFFSNLRNSSFTFQPGNCSYTDQNCNLTQKIKIYLDNNQIIFSIVKSLIFYNIELIGNFSNDAIINRTNKLSLFNFLNIEDKSLVFSDCHVSGFKIMNNDFAIYDYFISDINGDANFKIDLNFFNCVFESFEGLDSLVRLEKNNGSVYVSNTSFINLVRFNSSLFVLSGIYMKLVFEKSVFDNVDSGINLTEKGSISIHGFFVIDSNLNKSFIAMGSLNYLNMSEVNVKKIIAQTVFISSKKNNFLILNQLTITDINLSNSFLSVDENNTITLNNVSFSNVNVNDNGGIIFSNNKNNLNISASYFYNIFCSKGCIAFLNTLNKLNLDQNFVNSSIAGIEGGSIYSLDSNEIIISNSMFMQGKASRGAVFYLAKANLFILTNSTFLDNMAESSSILYAVELNRISINNVINNENTPNYSNFTNGGVFQLAVRNEINITQGSFFSLSSEFKTLRGHLIYFGSENKFILTYIYIYHCEAVLAGGCFFFLDHNIGSLKNISLFESQASQKGGILYADAFNSILIEMSIFTTGVTEQQGGHIYLENSNTIKITDSSMKMGVSDQGGFLKATTANDISLINSKFEEFVALTIGGVLYIEKENNSIVIDSCSFDNNMGQYAGFAYFKKYSNVKVFNSSFAQQTSESYGGAIVLGQNTKINIAECTFSQCSSLNDDGSVLITEDQMNIIDIESSSFLKNSAGANGGAFSINYATELTISNSSFINNSAGDEAFGGCIFCNENNTIIIESSFFQGCHVGRFGGGGIFAFTSYNRILFKNNVFKDTKVESDGAAFVAYVANYLYDNSSIYENISNRIIEDETIADFSKSMGGIGFIQQLNDINFENVVFLNISTAFNGGLTTIETNNSISMKNVSLHNIFAGETGGVIFAQDNNVIIITDSKFKRIRNGKLGGFIYALFTNYINIASIEGNGILSKGEAGGLAYLEDINTFLIDNSIFNNVSTGNYGGLIYSKFLSQIFISNSIFSYVNASESGAAFYLLRYNHIKISNTIFVNITSNFLGSFVYAIEKNTLIFEKVNISNSSGSGNGGIFYIETLNEFNLSHSIIGSNLVWMGSEFFFLEKNFIEFSSIMLMKVLNLGKVDYFIARSNNTIIFTNNLVEVLNISIFFHFDKNIILFFRDNKFRESNLFDNFIVANSFCTIFIQNFIIGFQTNKVAIFLADSESNITNITIYQKQKYIKTDSLNGKTEKINLQTNSAILYGIRSTIIINKLQVLKSNRNSFACISAEESIIFIYRSYFQSQIKKFKRPELIFKNSNIVLRSSIFLHARSISDGGLIYVELYDLDPLQISSKNSIIFERSLFYFNSALRNGGVLFFRNNSKVLNNSFTSKNCKYVKNSAFAGGALSLENITSIQIENNTFYKNRAIKWNHSRTERKTAKGGTLYLVFPENALIDILNNSFRGNHAKIGGAIFAKHYLKGILPKNEYYANKAEYFGSDVASIMTNITFKIKDVYGIPQSDTQQSLPIDNVVSGKNYIDCLALISGVDTYGNSGYNIDEDDPFIKSDSIKTTQIDDSQHSNTLVVFNRNGQFCLNKIVRNQTPLNIKLNYLISFKSLNYNLQLQVSFRNCFFGERLTDSFECQSCDPGYYSTQTNFTEPFLCMPCTTNLPFICFGGDKVMPLPGYWRASKYSMNFLRCNQKDLCQPFNESFYSEAISAENTDKFINLSRSLDHIGIGLNFYTGSCKIGYEGPFCGLCQNDYGKMGKYNCLSCSNNSWFYYLIIVVQIIMKLFYLFYCVFMALKMMFTIKFKQSSKTSVIVLNLLKVLVIHIQILSFILKMPFDRSDDLNIYLPILFSFSPDITESFNLECFMKSLGINLPEQYFILIFVPIYIVILFLFSFALIALKKGKTPSLKFKSINYVQLSLSVFFIIMILTFTDLCKTNFEMFQCINIDDNDTPDFRLVNDLSIECNSFYHNLWKYAVTLPVLVFCFFILLYILVKMTIFYLLGKLEEEEMHMEFAYFYFAYKRRYFYWDFVILIRRLLILFVFLFFYEEMAAKNIMPIASMVLVLLISLGLQIYIKPFSEEYHIINNFEVNSLIALFFSYFAVLLLGTYYFADYNVATGYFWLTAVFIIIINCVFALYMFKKYYIFYLNYKLKGFRQFASSIIRSNESKTFLIQKHEFFKKLKTKLIKKNYIQEFNAFLPFQASDLKYRNQQIYSLFYNNIGGKLRFNNNNSIIHNDNNGLHNLQTKEKINHFAKNEIETSIEFTEDHFKYFNSETNFLLYKDPQDIFSIFTKKQIRGQNHTLSFLQYEINLIVSQSNFILKNYWIDSSNEDEDHILSVSSSFYENERRNEFTINFRCSFYETRIYLLIILENIENRNCFKLKINLPISIFVFIKHIPLQMKIMKEFIDDCESLSSCTFSLKSQNSAEHFLHEFSLLFPEGFEITTNSYICGLFTVLAVQNCILLYVLKINVKLSRVLIEILDPHLVDVEQRGSLKRIAHRVLRRWCYIITHIY